MNVDPSLPHDERPTPYVLAMLVLSVLSLVVTMAMMAGGATTEQHRILDMADLVVCGLFFLDFCVSLWRARNKWAYLWREWGWMDFLSSIPVVDALRWGRMTRIVKILRVIRAVKSANILWTFAMARRAQSAFLAVALMLLVMVVVASISILSVETSPASNIHTAGDALWWTITTMTTVGYGDLYPVTDEGRAVAVAVMVFGVGLFGTLSGVVASWLLASHDQEREATLSKVLEELAEIKAKLNASPSDPPP